MGYKHQSVPNITWASVQFLSRIEKQDCPHLFILSFKMRMSQMLLLKCSTRMQSSKPELEHVMMRLWWWMYMNMMDVYLMWYNNNILYVHLHFDCNQNSHGHNPVPQLSHTRYMKTWEYSDHTCQLTRLRLNEMCDRSEKATQTCHQLNTTHVSTANTHESPKKSWNLIFPMVVSASKLGKTSPSRTPGMMTHSLHVYGLSLAFCRHNVSEHADQYCACAWSWRWS